MKEGRSVRMKGEMVEKMDYEKIVWMYEEGLKEGREFRFILVGKVDVEGVKGVIECYVG